MSTLVALAMAEIASALPDRRRPLLLGLEARQPRPGAWFTGWFNLIGQIAVTAAIGYGLAIFGTALMNYWFEYPEHEGVRLPDVRNRAGRDGRLNLFRVTLTAMLNTISAYWHMIGVGVIVLHPGARSPTTRAPSASSSRRRST